MLAELTTQERKLLTLVQGSFPLVARPFADLGASVALHEEEVLEAIRAHKASGLVRQISAIFDTERLGYASTLVALQVSTDRLDEVAAEISRHPGVSHNYGRDHRLNLWFTLAVPAGVDLEQEWTRLVDLPGIEACLNLPRVHTFKIRVHFDMVGTEGADSQELPTLTRVAREPFDPGDIPFVRALQDDLPLVPRPFAVQARGTPLTEETLLQAATRLTEAGVMRRYGAILRHRRAGYSVNAMGCWHLPQERVREAGNLAARLKIISHCYERPAYPPAWPYQLFTMIHSHSQAELEETVAGLHTQIRPHDCAVLASLREYKKVRLRYFDETSDR